MVNFLEKNITYLESKSKLIVKLFLNIIFFVDKLFHRFINLCYPPKCLTCSEYVQEIGGFCSDCWSKLDLISSPACDICSYPFEYEVSENVSCPTCLSNRPKYNKLRSIFALNDKSKDLIHDLKYNDKTYLAVYVANLMYRRASDLFFGVDLIIPVPLHPKRLFSRLYNQSALLAKHLSKQSGISFEPRALLKIKNTNPQTGLKKLHRLKNLKNVFKINPKYQHLLEKKNILLIDDVMTTGSTIKYCTKELLRAGAKRVDVLTIARTL